MFKLKSWNTFAYFARAYPGRGALMVASLSAAGLMEGLGFMALLPLIGILTGDAAAAQGAVGIAIERMFGALGLITDMPTILLFLVAIMVMKALLMMVAMTQVAYASSHVAAALRLDYIRNLLKARWLHFVGLQSGASTNTLGTEAQRAAMAFKMGCQTVAFVIQIAVYAILACLISWQLTIAALFVGGFMLGILGFMTKITRKAGREQTTVFNHVLSLLTDALYGAKPIKAMNKAEPLTHMLETDVRKLQSTQRRLELADQGLWVLSEPLMVVFVALGLYGALTYATLPMTELMFMAVVFLRMVMRISSAQRSYQSMVGNESALWSLREKIDTAADMRENFSGKAVPTLHKAIEMDDISFVYGERPIFENMNAQFSVRKCHAVFGPSGSGKTTLVDLVTGLLAPGAGRVLIDGVPMDQVDIGQWRGMIGYVPQDVLLFNDTVAHNVTLGDARFCDDDVRRALEKAGAWEFVSAMPGQLAAMVGERGARMSGGQRQRIAIARALVHNPDLLVLDEATSALDPETEKAILATVKDLSQSVTVLAISHNPAVLDVADHVYVLGDGKLTESVPTPTFKGAI